MSFKRLTENAFAYMLIRDDAEGRERLDDHDRVMSERVIAWPTADSPTGASVMSDGWRGDLVDLDLKLVAEPYDSHGGQVVKLECGRILRNGGRASGTHSAIVHPEITHVVGPAACR